VLHTSTLCATKFGMVNQIRSLPLFCAPFAAELQAAIGQERQWPIQMASKWLFGGLLFGG